MKKKLRIIAFIVSHAALVLAVAYLIFFLVCSVRAKKAADAVSASDGASIEVPEQDRYLEQAMREQDFSLVSVGHALSEESDSGREMLLWIIDLVIPVLCIASGILLQIAAARGKHKNTDGRQPSSVHLK